MQSKASFKRVERTLTPTEVDIVTVARSPDRARFERRRVNGGGGVCHCLNTTLGWCAARLQGRCGGVQVVGVWIEEVDLLTVHPEISLGRILLGVPYPWHLQKLERKQSTTIFHIRDVF